MVGIEEPAQLDADEYYAQAFARNMGLISIEEQALLRKTKIAIPGMGGMGGVHFVNLVRTGIGQFNIADPDHFDLANINRQYGASMNSVGRNKAEVMAEIGRGINPHLNLNVRTEGINADNIDEFLKGADVIMDGLDIFVPETRQLLYQKARENGQYVVIAGPIGFSGMMAVYSPTGMSLEKYLGLEEGLSHEDMVIALLANGLLTGTQRHYMDLSKINFGTGAGPSLGLAASLGSAMATAEVINILLKKRPIKAIPHNFQFDALTMQYKKRYLWLGGKNPLLKLRKRRCKRLLRKYGVLA